MESQVVEIERGALAGFHVAPPLVEIIMLWPPAARSVPSADEAMEFQALSGALVRVQLAPPFVEV